MLVSVIVPVYNEEKDLRRCVDSILHQTYKNIEIILVDDGSTDQSGKICDEYAVNYSNIKVIHKENGGLSSARNVGINEAAGSILGFVDSDDYIASNMIEVLAKPLIENNAELSVCGWYVIRANEITRCHYKKKDMYVNSETAIFELLSYNGFDNFACNKLFKKHLFNDINFPMGKVLEDLDTIYKLIHKASMIYLTSKPLYYYDIHVNSITGVLNSQIHPETFEIYENRRNKLLEWYPNLKVRINENYFLACRLNYLTAIKSKVRYLEFEKYMLKEMRNNLFYMLNDKESHFRMRMGGLLICCLPCIYRFRR